MEKLHFSGVKNYLFNNLLKSGRSELTDYQEQQEQKQIMVAEEKERKRLEQWARQHHHLISTEVQPGIYNSPFQP